MGDQLHQMPIRIVEIDASATIKMIDLPRLFAAEICVMLDTGSADTGERRVKLLFADQEGEVPLVEVRRVGKIEGYPVVGLDRYVRNAQPPPAPPLRKPQCVRRHKGGIGTTAPGFSAAFLI